MRTLNLGILAHVDAGKTTLTERLLYAAGVIDAIGSVDEGTTQTDTLDLERQRGITIRSAVVSFAVDDVTINLMDTPGHPDFIAEVERVLNVLDGAVLVISAVEGVQPQTLLLMRALHRLSVPTLIFVNKIDRAGADDDRTLEAITRRLSPAIISLGSVEAIGTRDADFVLADRRDPSFRAKLGEVLAERDDRILATYVADERSVPYGKLRRALVAQSRTGLVHPVFFGSAITGAGVAPLMAGIAELLPATRHDADGPVSGIVFKIERGPGGEKRAYVRMFSGAIRVRDTVRFGTKGEDKVTAIRVFDRGAARVRPLVGAGEIGMLAGLAEVKIGDAIGTARAAATHHFAPPTLESVVSPIHPADKLRLRVALGQLAEQDPLINVRQDDARGEIAVSLYGEVQKEVIGATLRGVFDVEVAFREATTIHIERPVGQGEAVEVLFAKTKSNVTGRSSPLSSNPFQATLGLRVEPAPVGSGVELRLEVGVRLVPLYIYRTVAAFGDHMIQNIRDCLEHGLRGWRVTDCLVTVTDCGYRAPGTTAADFRQVTALVLRRALEHAGTIVCEPMARAALEIPTTALGTVLPMLARLGARAEPSSLTGDLSAIEAVMPSAAVDDIRRRLPSMTGGEGVLESTFAGYRPVSGDPPTR